MDFSDLQDKNKLIKIPFYQIKHHYIGKNKEKFNESLKEFFHQLGKKETFLAGVDLDKFLDLIANVTG